MKQQETIDNLIAALWDAQEILERLDGMDLRPNCSSKTIGGIIRAAIAKAEETKEGV